MIKFDENLYKFQKLNLFSSKQKKCNTKPELKMKKILNKLGIIYIHQKFVSDIVHKYNADFFIPHLNCIIEVDGKHWHNYPEGNPIDKIRTKEMEEKGYKVLRFWEGNFNLKKVQKALGEIANGIY